MPQGTPELQNDASEASKADAKNLPMMKEKGLEAINYSADELAAFRKAGAKPVWDDWLASMKEQGLPGQELLDLIMATAEKASK